MTDQDHTGCAAADATLIAALTQTATIRAAGHDFYVKYIPPSGDNPPALIGPELPDYPEDILLAMLYANDVLALIRTQCAIRYRDEQACLDHAAKKQELEP